MKGLSVSVSAVKQMTAADKSGFLIITVVSCSLFIVKDVKVKNNVLPVSSFQSKSYEKLPMMNELRVEVVAQVGE